MVDRAVGFFLLRSEKHYTGGGKPKLPGKGGNGEGGTQVTVFLHRWGWDKHKPGMGEEFGLLANPGGGGASPRRSEG